MAESLFSKVEEKYKNTKDIKKAILTLTDAEKNNLINWLKREIAIEDNLEVYTDGASRGNPGQSGYGFLIYSNNKLVEKKYGFLGKKTNNQAEYIALLEAVKSIKKYNCNRVKFFMDSQLVVRQFKGIYRVKNNELKKYYLEINKLLDNIDNVQFVHIGRENNTEADKLANQAIDEHNGRLDE